MRNERQTISGGERRALDKARSTWLRGGLLVAGLLIGLAMLWFQRNSLGAWLGVAEDDFVQYWAAGRLNIRGENPYDLSNLLVVERSVGLPDEQALPMFLPPWVLSLTMPFGLLSYPLARVLWLFSGLAVVIASGTLLWFLYGGHRPGLLLVVLVSLSFAPTLFALRMGQIGVWMLLGEAGFLVLMERRKPFAAGLLAALLTLKPQLLVPFWFVVALWVMARKSWLFLAGVAVSLGLGSLAALIPNYRVFAQFVSLMVSHPPSRWLTPTIGSLVRLGLDIHCLWPQFLMVPPALTWSLVYWYRHRQNWTWARDGIALLFCSLIATPYGWSHDFVLLLPAVLWLAVQLQSSSIRGTGSWLVAGGYCLVEIGALLLHLARIPQIWFVWLPPALVLVSLCGHLSGMESSPR